MIAKYTISVVGIGLFRPANNVSERGSGIYPASKASVEGEATIICGGPCGAVAPPMPPHPALAPAKPDARFGFAGGGGDASPLK
ncbi:MAG: hypothetical protein HZA13_08200 [Nitrospirae bacterium]|nr:hypothetical protein [Nitrospirota bacterium]